MRRHLCAVLLAVLVGCVMASSPLVIRLLLGHASRGIAPIISPLDLDGGYYHAVLHETLEGGRPWDALLADKEDAPYPFPDLTERTMAAPARVVPMRVPDLLVLWRFLLPALLVLVIYAIGTSLVGSRAFGLASAAVAVCLPTLVQSPMRFLGILLGTAETPLYTIYDRPVHPQFEAPLVWAFLFCLVRSMETGAKRRWWVSAGYLLGLLTSLYVWAWTWGYAAIACVVALSLIRRDASVRNLVKAWGLGFLLGLPWFIGLAQWLIANKDTAYAARMSFAFGHAPAALGLNLPVIFGLVMLAWLWPKLTTSLKRFTFGGSAATLFALNQQVVSGMGFPPDHYLKLIGYSFVLWTACLALWVAFKDGTPHERKIWSVAAIIFSIASLGGIQARIVQGYAQQTAAVQSFADVADFLDHAPSASTGRKPVVFTNLMDGILVRTYTPARLWWHTYAMGVPQDPDRIRTSAFLWLSLADITPQDIASGPPAWKCQLSKYFMIAQDTDLCMAWATKELPNILPGYEVFLREQGQDLGPALRTSRVDYILHDAQEDRWDPQRLGVGEVVMRNERFTLYRALP